MLKKKICYTCGISSDWAFAAANVAIGINIHCTEENYDIVVFHTGLSKQDEEALNRIPHCLTQKYEMDKAFVDHVLSSVSADCKIQRPEDILRFSSFEAFRLLDEYEFVVWLDADILIQDDLKGMEKFGPFAAIADIPYKIANQFVECPPIDIDF